MIITAVDTNIFLDVLIPNEKLYAASAEALETAARDGLLVVCDLVYAELCVHFPTQEECDVFLESNNIRVETLTKKSLFAASRIWRMYRKQGGQRTRILSEFLIGAHAQIQASRLLSRDRGFYQRLFPKLALVEPYA